MSVFYVKFLPVFVVQALEQLLKLKFNVRLTCRTRFVERTLLHVVSITGNCYPYDTWFINMYFIVHRFKVFKEV